MPPPSVRRPLEGRRILVVEDADDIRELLALLVRLEGADVRTAASAAVAMETAASWEFDVLLTDLGLPDMPGDLLIKHIRTMRRRRPRVIVVTGFGEPYLGRARQAGADAVFVKPLEWSVLREELAERDPALVA
jgi:CheY-like chemotaxis protein